MSFNTSISEPYARWPMAADSVRNHPVVAAVIFAVVLGMSAQLSVPLPGTPVVLTGQTFAILVGPFVLGATRAVSGSALYVVLGALGVPWFAVTGGATIGYLVGFVAASALLGVLADRGIARGIGRIALAMGLGNVVIYVCGVMGLMAVVGMDLGTAIALGVGPFLIGDAVKLAVAVAAVRSAMTGRGPSHS